MRKIIAIACLFYSGSVFGMDCLCACLRALFCCQCHRYEQVAPSELAVRNHDQPPVMIRRPVQDNSASPQDERQSKLRSAAQRGDTVEMEQILQEPTYLDAQELGSGETALHKALSAKQKRAAQLLIQRNASLDISDIRGNTPKALVYALRLKAILPEEERLPLVTPEHVRLFTPDAHRVVPSISSDDIQPQMRLFVSSPVQKEAPSDEGVSLRVVAVSPLSPSLTGERPSRREDSLSVSPASSPELTASGLLAALPPGKLLAAMREAENRGQDPTLARVKLRG